MAPTIGAANFLAVGRVVGTFAGALAAVAFYVSFALEEDMALSETLGATGNISRKPSHAAAPRSSVLHSVLLRHPRPSALEVPLAGAAPT